MKHKALLIFEHILNQNLSTGASGKDLNAVIESVLYRLLIYSNYGLMLSFRDITMGRTTDGRTNEFIAAVQQ